MSGVLLTVLTVVTVVLHLDVVEPGVDVVVLLHEVVERPDLGAERREVGLVPGQVRLLHAGVQRVGLVQVQVVTAEVGQDGVVTLVLVLVVLQRPEVALFSSVQYLMFIPQSQGNILHVRNI